MELTIVLTNQSKNRVEIIFARVLSTYLNGCVKRQRMTQERFLARFYTDRAFVRFFFSFLSVSLSN